MPVPYTRSYMYVIQGIPYLLITEDDKHNQPVSQEGGARQSGAPPAGCTMAHKCLPLGPPPVPNCPSPANGTQRVIRLF